MNIKRAVVVVVVLCMLVFAYGCGGKELTASPIGAGGEGSSGVVVEERVAPGCTDSDNGIKPDVSGIITGALENGEKFEYSDECVSSLGEILIEYYCKDGLPANRNIRCENKCVKGACVQ